MRRSVVVSLMLMLAAWMLGWSSPAHAFWAGFIENRGQVNEAVRYYLPGSGAAVYFTPQAVVVDLKERVVKPVPAGDRREPRFAPELADSASVPQTQRGCAVYIRFEGANPSPRIEARQQLVTQYNFFLGNDPAKWRSEVPAYGEVVYRDVWPGIDLVFREEGGTLAYEAVVRLGADAGVVAFAYEDADGVRSDGSGIERVETSVGSLVHQSAGLRGEFRWGGPGREVGGDTLRHLADIPEALLWSTFLGGSFEEGGRGLALDGSGNAVVAGITESPDFPTTDGAYHEWYNGNLDVFIAKISSSGSTLLWGTFLGGQITDEARALALDPWGNPVVTGYTSSSYFPTTSGAYDRSLDGPCDVFVSKLSASGSDLLWSTLLGGSYYDWGFDLAFDPAGNPAVMGQTISSDFPTTPGAYDDSYNGDFDVFVAKLSPTGGGLLSSTFLGGQVLDFGYALSADSLGSPVVAGWTRSSDFPTTPGAYDQSFSGGDCDAFVSKLSPSGDALLWSTFLGGSESETAYALSLHGSGDVVVTGGTGSSDFPTTPGAYDRSCSAGDVFLAKLSSTGRELLWGTFLGGSSGENGYALALDASRNALVTGGTSSSDFPTTPGAYDGSHNGGDDVFVSKLSSSGSALLWSTFLGGSSDDDGRGLALSPSGNPVVMGDTRSSDFPTTPGAYDQSYNGVKDTFVAEMGSCLECYSPQVRCVPLEYTNITTALDSSVAGDTVLVYGGSYAESGLTLKLGVVVSGAPGTASPVVTAGSGPIFIAPSGTDSTTVLRGFVLDGQWTASPGIRCTASSARIEGNDIVYMQRAAYIGGGGGPTFSGNGISDCLEGIRVARGTPAVLTENTFSGLLGIGIAVDSSAAKLRRNVITDCYVGVRCSGRPQPEVGGDIAYGNEIRDNNAWNLVNASPDTLEALCNYWGSTVWDEIAATLSGPVKFVPLASPGLDSCWDATSVPGGGSPGGAGESAFFLDSPMPNPSGPGVHVRYAVPAAGRVSLRVYDVSGRLVRRLVEGEIPAGLHAAFWDGKDEAGRDALPGVYFYRLEATGRSETRKGLLLR